MDLLFLYLTFFASFPSQYELQTFTEKRETSWAFTPYGGGDVDGPSNGPAPLPWDVEAHPAHMFHDEVKVVQVGHHHHPSLTCVNPGLT